MPTLSSFSIPLLFIPYIIEEEEIRPTRSMMRADGIARLLSGLATFNTVSGGTAKAPKTVRAESMIPRSISADLLNIVPIANPKRATVEAGRMIAEPKIPPYNFKALSMDYLDSRSSVFPGWSQEKVTVSL